MSNDQKSLIVCLNPLNVPQKNLIKTDTLYELEETNYKIQDTSHYKSIYCPTGFCTITDTKNNQSVVLDDIFICVEVNKGIELEITNCSDNVQIGINYYKD